MKTYNDYIAELYANRDEKYNAFNAPIVNSSYPTVGVRTPVIKKLAKSVKNADRAAVLDGFWRDKDLTYEKVLFAGCVIADKGDYAFTRDNLKKIIPLFGSWAHVDCVVPLLKWVDKDEFLSDFKYLLDKKEQYQVRTYIIFLFDCLSDEKIDFVLDTLIKIDYGEYYVDMAAAWLLAECLVKYYDKTIPLFTAAAFPKFVHNKAIQKARESFRISPETKEYLKSLKVK